MLGAAGHAAALADSAAEGGGRGRKAEGCWGAVGDHSCLDEAILDAASWEMRSIQSDAGAAGASWLDTTGRRIEMLPHRRASDRT